MKHTFKSFALSVALLLSAVPFLPCHDARAATWNDAFGMGNANDDWLFSGRGVLHGTIAGARSNFIYYITSAKSTGAPRITSANFWTDMSRPFVESWIATNTWTIASNAVAGTTNIWLTSTNVGMTTNDIFVLRNVGSDCYQQLILGGHTTSSSLVSTNALGENLVRFWTVPTNALTAGDILYQMARVQTITPTFVYPGGGVTTNALGAVITNYFTLPPGQFVSGKLGLPLMFGVWSTNDAIGWLNVSGEYYARPRR